MAPSKLYLEKSKQACNAMNRYGISPKTVRSSLKHLLKAYEKNWKYIEEDNYRVLLDAILEPEGPKKMEIVKHDFQFFEESEEEEEEPLIRRPRLRNVATSSSMYGISDSAGYSSENEGKLCLEYNFMDSKANKNEDANENVAPSPCSSEVDIAFSSNEEGKLTFSMCKPHPGFRIPSPDAVMKRVEDMYREKFHGFGTGFSLTQVLKDICECFTEQGNASDHVGSKHPSFNKSKEPEKQGGPTNDPILIQRFVVSSESDHCFSGKLRKKQMVGIDELSGSSSLTIIPKVLLTPDLCCKHYWVADITRGLEKHEISLVNEVDDEKLPTFTYIKTNVNYNTANVKPMLASISDQNSCPDCFGDCLSPEVACACAVETGGKFAYTTEGLVNGKFLKECIDIALKKRTTNQSQSGSFKGHPTRKFIKECWYKCGCGLNCGNRVVQRGIQARLQVFMTPEGKGWGLRTLENLPMGAFVCEYVGEIVTNSELTERNKQNKNEEHTYCVLLDADWSSERFLKDEVALYLDATAFGNAARFINHRCVDANMVEIPVEVESPNHHFYHHAFFTTREVKAMEELTWDYGIDFDDDSRPGNGFQCKCKSKSCIAVKRYKRSRRCAASDKQVIVRVN